jgi:3-phosphoshikimate 1-carboxyvinyltransferase
MAQRLSPAHRLQGSIQLPGDKSISHRYAILSSISEGTSRLHNYSTGADCQSTLGCMRSLGVGWSKSDNIVEIQGRGLDGLVAPEETLDAGNSGSTIRMLSGILAAQHFNTRIGGDESLSRRPMERIMTPLREMGASINAREGRFPPLDIHGGPLRAIDYSLPVASAQVKSCILFAGLYAPEPTTVRESIRTRDHSELALREFGADVTIRKGAITVEGRPRLTGRELAIPGDLSSAAFFLVAASIVPGSDLILESVGLNPTRAELIDFLVGIGAHIQVHDIRQTGGELIGNIRVRFANVRGGVIEKAMAAALIDEIPVLAILGARSEEGLTVRDASELRVKETDRIATVAENFRRMGVSIEVLPDGFHVAGRQQFRAAEFDSFGDHRIAMAFSIASLMCDAECSIAGAEAASVSYPEFFDTLRSIAA